MTDKSGMLSVNTQQNYIDAMKQYTKNDKSTTSSVTSWGRHIDEINSE